MAHSAGSLRRGVGGRLSRCCGDPRASEGNDNYRLAGRAASRAVQRVPAVCSGRCMGRIRRCTSPRCIRRDGRPSSTSPTAGNSRCHRRTVLPPPAVPADTQHSGWRYAEVAAGETFLALQQGLQNALWTLGGVPEVVRSDNTSAATHELRSSRGRALNDNYAALLVWPPLHPHQSRPEP